MGIGGRDYSHRSVQRSSLRGLGEGGGDAALDTLPASPKPPGGLSHPRWSRSLAYRRRLEPTRPEQHHLPAELSRGITGLEHDCARRRPVLTDWPAEPSAGCSLSACSQADRKDHSQTVARSCPSVARNSQFQKVNVVEFQLTQRLHDAVACCPQMPRQSSLENGLVGVKDMGRL